MFKRFLMYYRRKRGYIWSEITWNITDKYWGFKADERSDIIDKSCEGSSIEQKVQLTCLFYWKGCSRCGSELKRFHGFEGFWTEMRLHCPNALSLCWFRHVPFIMMEFLCSSRFIWPWMAKNKHSWESIVIVSLLDNAWVKHLYPYH